MSNRRPRTKQFIYVSAALWCVGGAVFTQAPGLKLESTKAPVNVVVIDHIERPTPN